MTRKTQKYTGPVVLGNERPEQDRVPKFLAGIYSGFGELLSQDNDQEKVLEIITRKKEIVLNVRVGDKQTTRTTNTTELNILAILPAFYMGRSVMAHILHDLETPQGGPQ